MYKNFYNLTMEPFRLTPDHHLCYRHPNYQRAKYYMEYAVKQGEDFVLITGEPGTGKTSLINEVLADVNEEKLVIARLIGMHLVREELLRMVAFAFGLNVATQDNVSILRDTRQFLIEQKKAGRRSLLIVDEAQTLSAATLEELRLLSNLQYHDVPLLQIFLVGQERLLEIVINPTMAQLHQRLIAACHLNPLSVEQTEAYIKHRLSLVGWQQDPKLDEDIFTLIHKHSRGIPRRINLLCNRLFISGSVDQKHEFTAGDVQHVIEELRRERLVHSEEEAVKKSCELPDHTSKNTVPRTSTPSETGQATSQQAITFPRIYQRPKKEAGKKPAAPLVFQGSPGIRYGHNNTIIVITSGFLLGIFLTLTFLHALNLQEAPTSDLLSQDEEARNAKPFNAKALYVVSGGNENAREAAIKLKSTTYSASENEQHEFVEEVSSDAGRVPDNAPTGDVKERQILTRPVDPHGALQQGKESDQQTQQNSLSDYRGGANAKVETRQPNSMTSVGNESMLASRAREGGQPLKQNMPTVIQLLAKAERQRQAFQLTIPQGDNARETYQRVLAQDPTNEEANRGLNELLQYYLQWASYYKKKGLFESSLDFVYRGLTLEPNNAELLALKEHVQLSLKKATQ